MYVIFNRIKVKAEYLEDFLQNVKIHAQNSSNEPGCVRYDVLQDISDPQLVFLFEVFKDEEAFSMHLTYDFYKDWMEKSKTWRHSEERMRHVMDYIFHCEDS